MIGRHGKGLAVPPAELLERRLFETIAQRVTQRIARELLEHSDEVRGT